MKYLLVRTKFYWSWVGGPVLIVRTIFIDHIQFDIFIISPHKQSLGGGYRNHPVRPSMYLVSTTPPKRLIGFL